jgi:hypothetical protein
MAYDFAVGTNQWEYFSNEHHNLTRFDLHGQMRIVRFGQFFSKGPKNPFGKEFPLAKPGVHVGQRIIPCVRQG